MSWPLTEWAEFLPGGWSNEAAEGRTSIRPLLPVYQLRKEMAEQSCKLHMSLGFVPFSEAPGRLEIVHSNRMCPGYRPAKHGREDQWVHRNSTPAFPEWWAASEVERGLSPEHQTVPGVDLFKKKKDLFRWCPRARAGHCSLEWIPSDHCWAQRSFTAVSWAGAEMTSPGEPCPWPESLCKEDCFTLWHTWRIIYATQRNNLNIWSQPWPTLRISQKNHPLSPQSDDKHLGFSF